jgi:peroxiredoxin
MMKRVAIALILVWAVAWPASALDVGPAVGTPVPAFSARDAGGAPRSLGSVMGPKGVVLVFFRSAKWCPYCQAQLMSLRDAPAALAARGYRLAAISYDPPAVLSQFAQQRDIPYTLLSDEGSKTIDAFGLRDPQYKVGSMAYGVPQPSIFIISPKGVIRAKLAEEGYKTRPPLSAVLAAIDQLPSR